MILISIVLLLNTLAIGFLLYVTQRNIRVIDEELNVILNKLADLKAAKEKQTLRGSKAYKN